MEITNNPSSVANDPNAVRQRERPEASANRTQGSSDSGQRPHDTSSAEGTASHRTDQLAGTLQAYGFKVTEENMAMLALMLDNAIPLTKENVMRMNQALKLTDSPEKALFLLQNGIRLTQANAEQLDGLTEGRTRITEQLTRLLEAVAELKDPGLRSQLLRILAAVESADAYLGTGQSVTSESATGTTQNTATPQGAGTVPQGEGALPQNAGTASSGEAIVLHAGIKPQGETAGQPGASANAGNAAGVAEHASSSTQTGTPTPASIEAQSSPAGQSASGANAGNAAGMTENTSVPTQTGTPIPAAAETQAGLIGQSASVANTGNAADMMENTSVQTQTGLPKPTAVEAQAGSSGQSASGANTGNAAGMKGHSSEQSQTVAPTTGAMRSAGSAAASPPSTPASTAAAPSGEPREPGRTASLPGDSAPPPVPSPSEQPQTTTQKLRLSFKLPGSAPEDIDRYINTLRDALGEAHKSLSSAQPATPDTARVMKEIQTLTEQIDFTAQIKNQLFVQLPVYHNGQETQTALYVYKDAKPDRQTGDAVHSALIALDTAYLGHFETYVQKRSRAVTCQFRLRDKAVEQLVRAHMPELNALLSASHYSLEAVSFLPPGESYTVLDSPERFTGEANKNARDGTAAETLFVFDKRI